MDFIRDNKNQLITLFIVLWIVISLITLFLYMLDKYRAKRNRWRVKELILLAFPWALGSLGGTLGVFLLRHKTKHWYFIINNMLALFMHIVLIVFLIII